MALALVTPLSAALSLTFVLVYFVGSFAFHATIFTTSALVTFLE